jgi:hypothetical protein
MPVTLARGLVTRIIKQLSRAAGGKCRRQAQVAAAGGKCWRREAGKSNVVTSWQWAEKRNRTEKEYMTALFLRSVSVFCDPEGTRTPIKRTGISHSIPARTTTHSPLSVRSGGH